MTSKTRYITEHLRCRERLTLQNKRGRGCTCPSSPPLLPDAINRTKSTQHMRSQCHGYLCLAELAAVGRIREEPELELPSFGDDRDRLPVLRRRLVGTLATLLFLVAAGRLLSCVNLSWRTKTPW